MLQKDLESCQHTVCGDEVQGILFPAEVTPGSHLSDFLTSIILNGSPEGSTRGVSGVQPSRAQGLPVPFTGAGFVKNGM